MESWQVAVVLLLMVLCRLLWRLAFQANGLERLRWGAILTWTDASPSLSKKCAATFGKPVWLPCVTLLYQVFDQDSVTIGTPFRMDFCRLLIQMDLCFEQMRVQALSNRVVLYRLFVWLEDGVGKLTRRDCGHVLTWYKFGGYVKIGRIGRHFSIRGSRWVRLMVLVSATPIHFVNTQRVNRKINVAVKDLRLWRLFNPRRSQVLANWAWLVHVATSDLLVRVTSKLAFKSGLSA